MDKFLLVNVLLDEKRRFFLLVTELTTISVVKHSDNQPVDSFYFLTVLVSLLQLGLG